jgi:hypothetical protein
MKNVLFIFIVFLMQISFAQGIYTEAQRKKDKSKLDSICRRSPSACLYFGDVIGINSIFRKLTPKKIDQNSTICFNKKFHYMATNHGKTMRGCFFINTNLGYVAMFMSNLDESCNGMRDPKLGFDMMIISKVGESFIYRINKRGKKTFMAQMPPENVDYGRPTNFVLKNPNALTLTYREPFTSENLPTLPYVIEGSSNSGLRYLFGGYHAQRIPLKDYIGAFGVGYYKDGMNNTFICLATESENQFVKIEKMEDVNECFDGRGFGDEMAGLIADNDASISEKEKRLQKQADSEGDKNCEAVAALIQHERQILTKEKILNDFVKNGGNINSKQGLKLASAAGDVIDQVIKHRLETEKGICSQQYSMLMNDKENNKKLKERAQKKLDCYKIAVNKYNDLQKELEKIDAKNGNNYTKAVSEKNMLYLKRMKDIDSDCNQDRNGNIKDNPMDEGAKKLRAQLQEMIKGK